jgi:DNA topoisomerase-2
MASKFKKIEHSEHILLRPDSYIGSVNPNEQTMWVLDDIEHKFKLTKINYNQGFDKIFDEIIVNAYDHATRQKQKGTNLVKNIEVTIQGNTITIQNDGEGIPIEKQPEYNCWIPELIFGTLLTSTNYDDSEERLVSGRNGYGAKLTNLFSSKFSIEIVDINKNKYTQTWSNNMKLKTEPKIVRGKTKPYVKIEWTPDLARFGYPTDKIPADMIKVFVRRLYDLAAVMGKETKIILNTVEIPVKSMKDYSELYLENDAPILNLKINDRWEICIADNPTKKFMQVSFVNGTWTSNGGTHVGVIKNPIIEYLSKIVSKKRKSEISDILVENSLAIFIKCDIVNPAFSGQMKETLKTKPKEFGSTYDIPEAFLKKISTNLMIVTKLMEGLDSKESKDAKKTDGKKTSRIHGIPKLDDATMAGTKESNRCSLILTEGDSAKAMVLSGLSQEQRKYYGVFPLKGKIMNVKDSSASKIHANEEIVSLKKILGLETGKVYENTSSLRYGSIMFMTDQDLDGSHIKGLGINLFHSLWRELSKIKGFITFMGTPIVKATKGKETVCFYTLQDYEAWKEADPRGWTVKYYKGLGTSDRKEAQEYFKHMNVIQFEWTPESDESIDLAFNEARADDRKEWLLEYDYKKILGKTPSVKYEEFIEKDLIHFSYYDNVRSIPNIMDGLKVSQRKILYSAFKRNLVKEIRVAQFAGYVSEHSGYHHGEASLNAAIVAMAQDFVGSNNINLFNPNGQFGTRLLGGKDSASTRYIHTELNPITFKLFPTGDIPVLEYEDDDGTPVEPYWYAPILPMILVNGAEGIGTGFSTKIPQFNPTEITNYLKDRITSKIKPEAEWDPPPYYDGFKGGIKKEKGEWLISGKWHFNSKTNVTITELPVDKWTSAFKELIEALIEKKIVADYVDTSTDVKVNIEVELVSEMKEADFIKTFHMVTKKKCSNMHLFDHEKKIKKFDSPKEIIDVFIPVRMGMYKKRKEYQLGELKKQISKHSAIVKFLTLQISGEIDLRNKSKEVVEKLLETHSLPKMDESFKYLLGMSFSSITKEEVEKHKETLRKLEVEFEQLSGKTIEKIWIDELDEFIVAYEEFNKKKLIKMFESATEEKPKRVLKKK